MRNNKRITITDPAEFQFKRLVFNLVMNSVNSENETIKPPDLIDLHHKKTSLKKLENWGRLNISSTAFGSHVVFIPNSSTLDYSQAVYQGEEGQGQLPHLQK